MASPTWLTESQLKAWRRDTTTANTIEIQSSIDAAFEALNKALQRRLVIAGASSARVYAPDDFDVLFIHDCTTVTSVTENGTLLVAGTDYQLEPLNGVDSSGLSVPYYRVRRLGRNWYRDNNKGTVSIVAAWGWAAIPSDLILACMIIASDMLENQNMRFGLAAITDAGGVGTRDNRTVREAILAHQYAAKTAGFA
jgi:hypothetical protein